MLQTINKAAKAVVAFAVAALAFLACDKSGDVTIPTISIQRISADSSASSQFVHVKTPSEWELSLIFEEGVDPWASLNIASGVGNRNVAFNWEENKTDAERSVVIRAENSAGAKELVFTQLAKGSQDIQATDLKPDPVPGWLELPATEEGHGRYFFTHDMTIASKNIRNYSFYLDAAARISVWVAYPLNKDLCSGGSGRTDAWGLTDPKVPIAYQSILWKSYPGSYDRGHQIPSADRQTVEANKQTYYGTNMTPQLGSLNQKDWSDLEGKVRNWSFQFDTLYVVTGADINGGYSTTTDNNNQAIAIPNGYFKALLGYKRSGSIGITGATGGYTGIGFYYEHRSYGGVNVMNQSMTIDQLEQKTGFDFFVNLPLKIDPKYAEKVESTKDPWWK